jgi:hypothetical protein
MVGNYETQFLNILAYFTQGHAFHKKQNALLPQGHYGYEKHGTLPFCLT